MPADGDRWNTNIHYHGVAVRALGPQVERVLDVGCGEGMLCRRLRRTAADVVGIDTHGESIELARAQSSGVTGLTYLEADFLRHAFAPGSFDGVVSVATLHHMDPVAALTRMAHLLRPGGTLAVIGLARSELPADIPAELVAVTAGCYHRLRQRKHRWEHPSPIVWPPPHTYREIRAVAGSVLPGVRYRRHAQWRYSLIWRKPGELGS